MRILLINGPNLNTLGIREPEFYGEHTLSALEKRAQKQASQVGATLCTYQSNAEHLLIEKIQQAPQEGMQALIVNLGAYTHTSIALRDALSLVRLPFIEVHLSNIYARESFRKHSYLADIALGQIIGMGSISYELAILAMTHYLHSMEQP